MFAQTHLRCSGRGGPGGERDPAARPGGGGDGGPDPSDSDHGGGPGGGAGGSGGGGGGGEEEPLPAGQETPGARLCALQVAEGLQKGCHWTVQQGNTNKKIS